MTSGLNIVYSFGFTSGYNIAGNCDQRCLKRYSNYVVSLRMGGIPAKSHKGEKLLLFMGIIDILQSYR